MKIFEENFSKKYSDMKIQDDDSQIRREQSKVDRKNKYNK